MADVDRIKHRFFAPSVPEAGELLDLDEGESRHALGALRLAPGTDVEVFDGRGAEAVGELAPAGRRLARVRVIRRRQAERPEPVVELAFAVPKGKRLDWLLEKAAELGAVRLQPVVFERSVAQPELSEHAAARWRGVCIAAAKQSGSAFLPEIMPPADLRALLARFGQGQGDGGAPGGPLAILGSAANGPVAGHAPPLTEAMAGWAAGRPIVLLIGPEGGLTDAERLAAEQAGFVPARLGLTVLRIETTAVALLAGVLACAKS